MAERVKMVPEAEATGLTADLYDRVRAATNLPFVPDVFRLTSTTPHLLDVVVTGYTGVFTDSALTRATKELIATWTSRLNNCDYCATTHTWFLQHFGGSAELAETISHATDPIDLPVDEPTVALLRLTSKVTSGSPDLDAEWSEAAEVWTEEQLLEAVFCAALFSFINRLVTTLGLAAPTP
ncbi:carboxymuconolactone decarboxylase family protein [Actinokineospora diospyrosa]|uniref:Peroxidase-related enzyme n=1 Tax=Actinokineospora diospyrosa TaxID=103728 RepID=A0ABT1IN64_9PSEU|nr:carboxymuconolactone decarboxylase family protein [Actinokineospora diospyrosa]MCP2274110.1 putative peroxidase-related enzyme [Actinokineospora diospyrosa]